MEDCSHDKTKDGHCLKPECVNWRGHCYVHAAYGAFRKPHSKCTRDKLHNMMIAGDTVD